MQHPRKRLSIRALRWPSSDHRDFQTVGRLASWLSRASRPAARPLAQDEPAGPAQLPALSTIVRVHREDALLHVEFLSRCPVVDGRSPVLVRDAAGAVSAGTAPARAPAPGAESRTWSVTLPLN